MSTVVEEVTELEAAREEHRAAVAEWRALEEAETELSTASTWKSGKPVARLDPVEAELERHRIATARPEAAERLAAARKRLAAAKVADANGRLPALVETYAQRAEAVEDLVRELETAIAGALAAAWRLEDARHAERLAAEPILNVALAGCADDEQRRAIAADANIKLPLSLGAEGVEDRSEGQRSWSSARIRATPSSGKPWGVTSRAAEAFPNACGRRSSGQLVR